MFLVFRDVDPKRPELFIRRIDGTRWVAVDDGNALGLSNKAEARALVEALMEHTMTIDLHNEGEAEDA